MGSRCTVLMTEDMISLSRILFLKKLVFFMRSNPHNVEQKSTFVPGGQLRAFTDIDTNVTPHSDQEMEHGGTQKAPRCSCQVDLPSKR